MKIFQEKLNQKNLQNKLKNSTDSSRTKTEEFLDISEYLDELQKPIQYQY